MLIYIKCLQISCHLSSGSVFLWRGVYFSELQKIIFEDLAEKLKNRHQAATFFLYFLILFDTTKFIYFPNLENETPKKMRKYIKLLGEKWFSYKWGN